MEHTFTATIDPDGITFEAKTEIPGSTGAVPTITMIDGGNSGDDTQFDDVNGLLDGCGA